MALQTAASQPAAAESSFAGDFSTPSAARSVVSLLIFLHLTCLFVVLASNLQRSPLQARLVSLFAVYTQTFMFDPDFAPYYLVSTREINDLLPDDDAVLTVDLYADAMEPVANQKLLKTVTLPDRGSRWLGDRRRYIIFSKAVALNGTLEADEVVGEMAKTVGRRILLENNARRAVFRAVRRSSQPIDAALATQQNLAPDPTSPRNDTVTYEADVWFDEDGGISVVKRAGRGEIAPRQTGS